MKKIVVGLTVLGVALVVVFAARKGLQQQTSSNLAPGSEYAQGPPVTGVRPTDRGPMYPVQEPELLPKLETGVEAAQPGAPSPGTTSPGTAGPRSNSTGTTSRATDSPRADSPRAERIREDEPAQDPEIATVLRRAAKVYAGAESLQADFSQRSMNPILRTTVASEGTLYQRRPDRFLMRFSDPAGDLIISDGSYFWVYYPSVDRKQVLRMPAGRGAGGVDLQAQFVGDPLERFAVTSEGREEIAGRSAHVLLLEPREALGYRALKVWIDADDYLVRQFEVTEENGMVRHFELSNLKLNPRLGDDLFHFTVPEGARVVDRG